MSCAAVPALSIVLLLADGTLLFPKRILQKKTSSAFIQIRPIRFHVSKSRRTATFGAAHGTQTFMSSNLQPAICVPIRSLSTTKNQLQTTKYFLFVSTGLKKFGAALKTAYSFSTLSPKTFQVFQHKNKDPPSIIANKVQCIFKDNRNRMWLGTNSGLSIYNPHSSQFQVEWISEDENCGVNDFLQVGKSFLVATSCGLFVKNKDNNSFEEIESTYKGEQLQITKLFMDSQRRIYVGCNKSMFMLDTSALSLKPIDGVLPLGYLDFYNITSSQINAIIEHPFRGSIHTWVSIFGHLISIHESGSLRAGAFVLGNAEKFENLVNKFFVDTKKSLDTRPLAWLNALCRSTRTIKNRRTKQ